jgi:hypothetical protein
LSSGSEGNDGDNGAEIIPVDELVLQYDRVHDKLTIAGHCESHDLMLDMLARATRTIEAQLRTQRAMETAAQMQHARQGAAIVDELFKRR